MCVISPVYPGTALRSGSSGSEVARMQTYLNALRTAQYPTLPRLTVDGRFGASTRQAVEAFQALKGLTADGVIGRNTWDAIVCAYNNIASGSANTYPGIALRQGSSGQDVRHMQSYLNDLAKTYTAINTQTVDGKYGANMAAATRRFQRQMGLSADGVIGQNTWNKIVAVHTTRENVVTPYPGYVLRQGASGDNVRYIQSYLNATGASLTVDGRFGSGTQRAVVAFQAQHNLTADGIVGSATWAALVRAFNAALAASTNS